MIKNKEKLIEYYNKGDIVNNYEAGRFNTLFKRESHNAEIAIINKHLQKYKNIRLLEIGVGTGRVTRNLKFSGEAIGVDSSGNMLEKIKETIKDNKWKFMNRDIMELGLKKDYFDVVVSLRVIRHFNNEEIEQALKQTYKVLKENGILIFDIPNSKYNSKFIDNLIKLGKWNKDKIYESTISIELLVSKLNSVGFSIIDIKPIKFSYLRLLGFLADITGTSFFSSYIFKKELLCYNYSKAADLLIIAKKSRNLISSPSINL